MNALQEAASAPAVVSQRVNDAAAERGGGGADGVVFLGEAAGGGGESGWSGAAGAGVRLRLLFGGVPGAGRPRLVTGRCFGVLGAEATHAGRRVRSWISIAELGEGAGRVPGVKAPVRLLAVAVQPRNHHRPGPVAELVSLVADLERAGLVDRAPARFWLAAGASITAGQGVRLPGLRERTSWSLGR